MLYRLLRLLYPFALRQVQSIICTDGSQENVFEQAAAYFARGGIAERIDYRGGNALEIIDETDFLLFARRSDRFVGAVTCICVTRHRRCRCLLSIKNVEKDIVFFGLRRGMFIDLLHVSVRFAPGQKATHGVKELTRLLYSSPEVFTTIIPLRDGISVAVKRKQDLQDLQDLQD